MDCGAGQRLTCSAAAETAAPLPSVSPISHQALVAFGHPGGLNVTLIDPDTASETNCVRQPFCRTEVGPSKAVVLAHRTNMFWGLNWLGMQSRIEKLKNGTQVDILIGYVDTRKADARSTAGRCAPECSTGLISATTHLAGSSSLGSQTIRRIERRSIASKPWPSCIPRSWRQVGRRTISLRAAQPKRSPVRSRSSIKIWLTKRWPC